MKSTALEAAPLEAAAVAALAAASTLAALGGVLAGRRALLAGEHAPVVRDTGKSGDDHNCNDDKFFHQIRYESRFSTLVNRPPLSRR